MRSTFADQGRRHTRRCQGQRPYKQRSNIHAQRLIDCASQACIPQKHIPALIVLWRIRYRIQTQRAHGILASQTLFSRVYWPFTWHIPVGTPPGRRPHPSAQHDLQHMQSGNQTAEASELGQWLEQELEQEIANLEIESEMVAVSASGQVPEFPKHHPRGKRRCGNHLHPRRSQRSGIKRRTAMSRARTSSVWTRSRSSMS